jgi:hypothetical protein
MKLKSTVLQVRLNGLMLLTTEQEMAMHICLEHVINDFITSTERRIVL